MIGKRFILIAVTSVFLLSVPVRGVLAGVEPSPFQPEINQLGAVENVINSTYERIIKVLDMPPVLDEPSPEVIGAVNRLEAIDKQLMSADDIIFSVVDEVMGVEPTPFRVDLIPALEAVRNAAQTIDTEISAFLPPTGAVDPTLPEAFVSALTDVQVSTRSIAVNVQGYIDDLSLPDSDCASYDNQAACEADSSCIWHFSDNIDDPGWCTYALY